MLTAARGAAHRACRSLAFDGPLALLLRLARAQQIDLARLSLPDLLDQLAAALQQAGPTTPLGEKGDWLVMASWLLLLRSRLLLPAATAGQQAAEDEARPAARAPARPAGGAGARRLAGAPAAAGPRRVCPRPARAARHRARNQHEVDVIEFLWASLALFDDGAAMPDTTPSICRPGAICTPSAIARERILRLLAETPAGAPLARFLPRSAGQRGPGASAALRRRSAWSSTFVASLELTRSGAVELQQEASFGEIHVRAARSLLPADGRDGDPADQRSAAIVSVG